MKCSIADCQSQRYKREYCNAHYIRIRKYGDPNVNKRVTHGQKNTKLYKVYRSMLDRCSNTNHHAYLDYGGRGIHVTKEWLDFSNFYLWAIDAGYHEGLTLGRVDNDKGYAPNNCRWETWRQQNNNTRGNVSLTAFGKTQTIMQWARIYDINYFTLWSRIKRGWQVEKALTAPVIWKRG